MKRFYNKWTHSWQYAKCGKCPACQQEKAIKRTQRLNNASYNGYVLYFITLTYNNECVPYIRRSELYHNPKEITIYRDCKKRKVRYNSDYDMAQKIEKGVFELAKVDCLENKLFPRRQDIAQLKKLKGTSGSDKIGVCYFKDIQDFEKRLHIICSRNFKIKKPLYSFKCSEYGPHTLRPHFHLGIYFPKESVAECTSAVRSAWPFCDISQWNERSIQLALSVSSYISSYVNRGSDFPRILSVNSFKPKHSYSVGFGTQSSSFSLDSICGCIRRGDLHYVTKGSGSSPKNRSVLLPKYALDRYFAKFAGYSRLSHFDIRKLCENPCILYENAYLNYKLGFIDIHNPYEKLVFDVNNKPCLHIDYNYDFDKIKKLINHLELRIKRFLKDFVYYENGFRYVGLPDNIYNRHLFADYMYDCWVVYNSNVYKEQFNNVTNQRDLLECYFNLDELRNGLVRSDLLSVANQYIDISYPNLYHKVIMSTMKLESIFHENNKSRKVKNSAMSASGVNV